MNTGIQYSSLYFESRTYSGLLEVFAKEVAFWVSVHFGAFWATPILAEFFAVGKRSKDPKSW